MRREKQKQKHKPTRHTEGSHITSDLDPVSNSSCAFVEEEGMDNVDDDSTSRGPPFRVIEAPELRTAEAPC